MRVNNPLFTDMVLHSRLPLQEPLSPELDSVTNITVNRAVGHFILQHRIVKLLLGT